MSPPTPLCMPHWIEEHAREPGCRETEGSAATVVAVVVYDEMFAHLVESLWLLQWNHNQGIIVRGPRDYNVF